jgi:hypothetical protein
MTKERSNQWLKSMYKSTLTVKLSGVVPAGSKL